nr:3-hydroxybutyrate oligomer hydrolase family protein [uncultured Duganella sp.]
MQIKTIVLALAGITVAACGSRHENDHPEDLNLKPTYLGDISSKNYDGASDDLLTAGLGRTGLAAVAPPAYADSANPTAAELRRNAIYSNYRAVLDIVPNSGYGTLYGPNVDARGVAGTGEGRIAGSEHIAYTDDNVTLMVQVPAGFDVKNPCIVTGTSSGSRGIYGAISTSGEWGLKNNCAVAYSDKGGGNGLYTFDDDGVNLQNGVRATRAAAGKNATFAPQLSDAERNGFGAAYPGRIAFKHAHSQLNPEKDWGKYTLQAVEFAFYVLNEKYGTLARDNKSHIVTLTPNNTITIASSISNGGGSALLAAEQDTKGLISGVAVAEPQVQPKSATGFTLRQGAVTVAAPGKSLYDYSTYAALYQPCIAAPTSPGRCTALVTKGLLSGGDAIAQQNDARARLKAYGWLADSDPLHAAHAGTNVLVAVTYAYAYGKFSVTDKVCGFTFSPTDASGAPVAFTAAQKAASFATQSGIIGSVVYEDAVGGAKAYNVGVSPSSNVADQSLDGFLCLRSLATGSDVLTGVPLTGALATQSARVRAGVAEVLASGNLKGKPAIIVHGRRDTLIPVNFASRAYVGLNAAVEGSASKLRYIEVSNANHFDSLVNVLPENLVPLHPYLFRALDAMLANLRGGTPLPPSQVIRTVARLDNTTAITAANLPPFATAPAAANAILVSGTTVAVPD